MDEQGSRPKTMFEKIWDAHVVREVPGESTVLYIDRHLVHEATSPQAFAGLRLAGIPVRRPDATIAVLDHNVPTVAGRKMLDVVDREDDPMCGGDWWRVSGFDGSVTRSLRSPRTRRAGAPARSALVSPAGARRR